MKQRLNTTEYKTRREVAPKKIINSIGDDQKSSWITNLNSCRNHESLRQNRPEARCYAGNLLEGCRNSNKKIYAKNERSFHEVKLHNST